MTSVEVPVEKFVLRSLDLDRDAEQLAAMWNASDEEWPGTWNRGVPMTAESVRSWQTRQHGIDTLIWEIDGAIAGYCSLWARPDEPNVTYVATLNVAPAYQGLSLGRKFLTHYVQRAIELGSQRLDLNTWPGNLKAVPLYKKCGFVWLPGTDVRMHNYLPTILTMPHTQSFFSRHDWYRSYQRELTQEPDDQQWEGMQVYTYRFIADTEQLTVWVDRNARRVLAIDTPDFAAAALANQLEPARGLQAQMHWRISNKRNTPLEVSLLASGTAELRIDYRQTLSIAPGETVTVEAPVQIAADAPPYDRDKAAPAVRSLLLIDGKLLELGTGLRPRAAVDVHFEPEYVTLTPNLPRTVELQLLSNLQQPLEGTLTLSAEPGLELDWTQRRFSFEAQGSAGPQLTLRAATAGAYQISVSLLIERDGQTEYLPLRKLAVLVPVPGGVAAVALERELWAENEHMRVIMHRDGAFLNVIEKHSNVTLVDGSGYPVPPQRPSEYSNGAFELSLEQTGERVVLKASRASREVPGFVVHKRFSMGAGPLCIQQFEFENRTETEQRYRLYNWFDWNGSRADLLLPLKTGLAGGRWAHFPLSLDDQAKQASAYAEQWMALAFERTTVGVVWSDDMEEIDWQWFAMWFTREYTIAPQSRICPQPQYLYVGEGGWQTVQRVWSNLSGQKAVWKRVLPPVGLRFEPPVLLAEAGPATVDLLLENQRVRPFNAQLQLELPKGWQASQQHFEPRDVSWLQPFRSRIELQGSGTQGVAHARVQLRSAERDEHFSLPLLCVGDGRSVVISEQTAESGALLRIENGLLELDVTPGFSASVSALRVDGQNLFATAHPQVATFGWMSPWYGGITPNVTAPDEDTFPGSIYRERFTAQIVDAPADGINWRGVRQQAELSREKLRGLSLEFDTLTTGGSQLVKLVLRLVNRSAVTRHVTDAGWLCYVFPGEAWQATTIWGERQQVKYSDEIVWVNSEGWIAAEHTPGGRTLVLVSKQTGLGVATFGADGGALKLLDNISVPAQGSVEIVAYLVVADSLAAAREYAVLQQL